jgi:apolipoprotein N-acyltransferase
VVTSERGPLGVLICYEDLFASAGRATVLLGARALVNLTNDAWFGASREPLLHDVLARMRSIELRRDLVRAVNTGVSSFTGATGEVLRQTRTFTRASFVADVRMLELQTVYARLGDLCLPLCLFALCGCLLWPARRERS